MKTGMADLPLHGGSCPAWLFKHMKALGMAIMEVIIEEEGARELLRRLSHPYWFQALGCVLGFDWHSSGVTTTVCGALKEGLNVIGPGAGIFMAGGKGRSARNTPNEIESWAERQPLEAAVQDLTYASKMAAKVDSTAVQDSYQIYHHVFIFTSQGDWAVIQQGMNPEIRQARRYHWLSQHMQSFVTEPQLAICCNQSSSTLNLVSLPNQPLQEMSTALSRLPTHKLLKELKLIEEKASYFKLPRGHSIPRTGYLNRALSAAYESQAQDFEQLLNIAGLGPGTLRALCLVAEIAYGSEASYRDPVRFSFAHGGKDGFPFPVNEEDIENSYRTLNRALLKAKAGSREQLQALRRLSLWHDSTLKVDASPISPIHQATDACQPVGRPMVGYQQVLEFDS